MLHIQCSLFCIIYYMILQQWLRESSVHKRTNRWAVCVFFLGNIFYYVVVKLSQHQCQPDVPVHLLDLASEEYLQHHWQSKEKKRKNLFCISASAQKDKFDELLGHSRLFLMLNMHPNTAFWQPNRGAGANARWGSGTKCYRKYGCAAQSTTWTEAFGRWTMTFLKDFE